MSRKSSSVPSCAITRGRRCSRNAAPKLLSRCCLGSTGIRLGRNMMAVQEGHSSLDTAVSVPLIGIDTHDMHFLRALQPKEPGAFAGYEPRAGYRHTPRPLPALRV